MKMKKAYVGNLRWETSVGEIIKCSIVTCNSLLEASKSSNTTEIENCL